MAVDRFLRARWAALGRAEARLAAGSYGRSVRSGQPIPDERLEADPLAELTVEEAAAAERGALEAISPSCTCTPPTLAPRRPRSASMPRCPALAATGPSCSSSITVWSTRPPSPWRCRWVNASRWGTPEVTRTLRRSKL
jgi:hypothetical protein